MKKLPFSLVLLLAPFAAAQKPDLPKFMGRQVIITAPPLDDSGFFPLSPASVCIEGPPQRQCYTAPKDFGRAPTVEVVQTEKGNPALFFSVMSGGVSGAAIHFSLLRPQAGNLNDIFMSDATVSNQSRHGFWSVPDLSLSPIFVTADFVWGPDEAHYDLHRYVISTYVLKHHLELEGDFYYLEDRYMTVRKYDYENDDILGAEKPEILARLRRVKAEAAREQRPPH